MPGVHVVQKGGFVGVVAPDSRTAQVAIAMLDATWETVAKPSRSELFQYLKDHAEGKVKNPEIEQIFMASKRQIEQTFSVDYIAHVPLEPRAGLVQWEGDQLTVWTGTAASLWCAGRAGRGF